MAAVICTCGETFEARDPRARYCSDRCRKRASRSPAGVVKLPVVTEAPSTEPEHGPIETATRLELAEADRLDTSLGLVVIALARRLDHGDRETGSAYSSLAARYEAQRAVAMKGAGALTAPRALNDEVGARRAMRA